MSMLKKRALLECKCGCGAEICCNRCLPLNCFTGNPVDPVVCPNALPLTLNVVLTATPNTGGASCFNGSGALIFETAHTGGVCCWEGVLSGFCTDCNGGSFMWQLAMKVCCSESGWIVSGNPTAGSCTPHLVEDFVPTNCNPVSLSGCFSGPFVGCFLGCLDGVNVVPSPTFQVCFVISEPP